MKNIISSYLIFLHIIFITSFLFYGCSENIDHQRIIGVKVYPDERITKEIYNDDYFRIINDIKNEGYNTIFSPGFLSYTTNFPATLKNNDSVLIKTKNFSDLVKSNKLKFALIIPVFHDPASVMAPKLVSVDQNGNSDYESWQKFVCPSNEEYRNYKLNYIQTVVKQIRPDIISLDFIRYPVDWELIKDNNNYVRNFCFCKRCLTIFSNNFNLNNNEEFQSAESKTILIEKYYSKEFTQMKCSLITSFVAEVKEIVNHFSPLTKINLHIVPWFESDYENGLQRIAGQNLSVLSFYVDYFSPMSYHKMLNRDESFIMALSDEIRIRTGKKILSGLEITSENDSNIKSKIDSAGFGRVDFHWGIIADKK